MTDIVPFAWQALCRHFKNDDLTGLASSRRKFAPYLLPDLQTVIEDQTAPLSPKLVGVHQRHEFDAMKLSDMVIREGEAVVALTPLQYQDIDIGEDVPYASLHNGLWLFHVGEEPVAILLSQFFDYFGGRTVQVEIAYLHGEQASAFSRKFLGKIQAAGESSRYYRNKVLSFEPDARNSGMPGTMRVHRLPAVPRNDVVLSEATMARLDAHIFDFDRHREGLKRLCQSTQKGVLLYGPPGTGKTHVIRYVSANLPGRTTVLVTAEQTIAIGFYIALARTLQPSIVVLEDVDLVGRSRENTYGQKAERLLNRLLNEMDGLEPDADILFILTTNRPEDIEDALASRPGRVDEAIEIPLPDAGCRERLIALYGRALVFEDGAVADAVARSEDSSAAYVKEMVRRLAQRSLARDGGDVVSREDVEMVFGDTRALSSRLNRRLVGLSEKASRRQNPEEDECDCCD
ncbi:cell division protein FtsH [Mesorhizobium tianshanense]|uniref:ATPase family protein associated with various cellular activities (AAA) n=1 Tax=Mesorhizobium tianshanense TaxID=39844 RepID=A0A562NFP5_9HYPH|nr:ATP-binding protein [Mesorhizobium tianshanense]TWI30900.1 ATPase family protein associated with various cellular activities (AAA) [Mesorhizobium tianshanense]GLS37889.1 cell division protein FtsH [Mesorhizobium tianshanense]